MFASLQIHGQILGRRAWSARPQGFATIVTGALLSACMVGCGQKGPLFLPGPPPPLATTAVTPIAPTLASPVTATPSATNRPAATPQ